MKNQPKVPLVLWVVCIGLGLIVSGLILYRYTNPREQSIAIKFEVLTPFRNQTVLQVALRFLNVNNKVTFTTISYTYSVQEWDYEWQTSLNQESYLSGDSLLCNLISKHNLDMETINYENLTGTLTLDYSAHSHTTTFSAIPNSTVEIFSWW